MAQQIVVYLAGGREIPFSNAQFRRRWEPTQAQIDGAQTEGDQKDYPAPTGDLGIADVLVIESVPPAPKDGEQPQAPVLQGVFREWHGFRIVDKPGA